MSSSTGHFHSASNEKKAVNVLYGILMGIMADNHISDEELEYLELWLKDNQKYLHVYPLNIIHSQLINAISAGQITEEARDNLHNTLSAIIGGTFQETGATGGLSFGFNTDSPNQIHLKDNTFCLTGGFVSGNRKYIEKSLKRFGAIIHSNVNLKTHYLIIGPIASRDWKAAGHGTKIEKALQLRDNGKPIQIITEETLLQFIGL